MWSHLLQPLVSGLPGQGIKLLYVAVLGRRQCDIIPLLISIVSLRLKRDIPGLLLRVELTHAV